MTIQGVGAATNRNFNDEELDALHRDRDTSAVVNQARRNAGQKGDDVSVRGDDGTLRDRLETNKTHVSKGKVALAVFDAIHVAEGVGWMHVGGNGAVAGHTAGVLGVAVALPVATLIASQVALAEMQYEKDGTRDAATRDVLHAGMLLSLELPKSFVDSEIGKLGVGSNDRSPASRVSAQLKGTPLGATLQLHCDRGMHAAQDFMLVPGRSKEQFLAAHPTMAERYASDAAFRAGFDGYLAASPEDRNVLDANLRARDVRYQAGAIPVRV